MNLANTARKFGIARSTVIEFKRRLKAGKGYGDKPRSGCPAKLKEDRIDKLEDFARYSFALHCDVKAWPKRTLREFAEHLHKEISTRTVSKYLRKRDFYPGKQG